MSIKTVTHAAGPDATTYVISVGGDPVGGTHFQGEVRATYARLLEVFGPPTRPNGDEDKVDREWVVTFTSRSGCREVATVATIYNWEDGPNYLGIHGTPPENILDWHVGGFGPLSLSLVAAALAPSVAPTECPYCHSILEQEIEGDK